MNMIEEKFSFDACKKCYSSVLETQTDSLGVLFLLPTVTDVLMAPFKYCMSYGMYCTGT